jgi:putative ABC transport system permease protein
MKTFLPRLALSNIIQHPLRSLITVFGISLGVAVILAVAMLTDATHETITRTVEELGSGQTDIWIEEMGEKTSSIGSRQEGFPETISQQILDQPGVASVHPMLEVRALGSSSSVTSPVEIYVYGVIQADDQAVRSYVLSSGNYPTGPQQVLVGTALAQELGSTPGTSMTLQSPNGPLTLEVSGLLAPDEGTGMLRNNRVVFADLATVQQAFHYQGEVTGLNVVLVPGSNPTEIAGQFREFLPENVASNTDPLAVASKRDDSGQLRAALAITSFFAILVGGFLVYNTLVSTAEESRREVALLRLAGMTPGQVARFFLLQALVYALFGTAAGMGLGVLLGWGMLQLIRRVLAFQTFILVMPSFSSILIAAGTGMLITLGVALLPALKTARVSPMAVFQEREAAKETAGGFRVRHAVGFALIALVLLLGQLNIPGMAYAIVRVSAPLLLFAGLMMVLDYILPFVLRTVSATFRKIFGIPGLLAVRSLRLRISRTVITIGAITVGLSIALGTLGMVYSMKTTTFAWLDKTRWADLLVFSISGTELNQSILPEMAGFPFIREVNPIRYYFVPYEHPQLSDSGFLFQAINPLQFQTFANLEIEEGNTAQAITALTDQPAILVNQGLAQRLDLQLGSVITLMTGQGPVDFTVAGTVADYSDFVHRMGKIVYGSYETLERYWGATGYTVLQVHLSPGYSADEAKSLLWQGLSGRYDVKILTHDEEKAAVNASIDNIFSSSYGIVVVMFLIVLMGVFNTVFINVLFQIREIAVLRTVGLLVTQVRLMVICEALAMGLVGSFFGILAGLWVAVQMNLGIRELMGVVIQFHTPWMMLGIILLLFPPVAVFATLYPQHIAGKLSIAGVMQSAERL